MAAIESAEPDHGPAADALGRLLAASWDELDPNEDIARASAAELSADAMRRPHGAVRAAIRKLVERDRRDGDVSQRRPRRLARDKLPGAHAVAAEEVRTGQLD
jgi:hypothetical protein